METVTIKRISRKDKVSKAGKPYTMVGMQVEEYGDTWINGFGSQANEGWAVGDKVPVTIKDTEYGKNFEMPKQTNSDGLEDALRTAFKRIEALEKWKEQQEMNNNAITMNEEPETNLPF